MTTKSLGLAAIALTCALGLTSPLSRAAHAQAAPPISPEQLKALLKQGAPVGGGANPGSASAPASITSGWNYAHCYAAVYYFDGSNYYEYAFNTEGTYFYYGLNSPLAALAQIQLKNACDTGHEYAVYVTNASTGAYSEIQVGF